MIDKIKKHDNIIVFIVAILISMGIALSINVVTGDELWNFNNAFKTFNGYKMYTDMNIIIPPMFFYIVNIIFHIIGANILTFKISGIIIYSFANFIIFNIFKALRINKRNAFCYLMIMQAILFTILAGGANYNFLAITFTLLGVYFLINEKSRYTWILQGIISYLVLFTKQNIGVYYIIAIFLTEIILNGINKKVIQKLLKQILITAILSIFNLFLLYLQGNLYDFINYIVLGIGEFTRNFSIDIYVILLICMDIIILIVTVFMNKKQLLDKKQFKNLVVLSVFSIMISFVVYPIINVYHIRLALIIPFITLFYILHFLIFEEFNLNKLINIIGIAIYIALFILSIYFAWYWTQNAKFELSYNHPYYGAVLEKETEEKISKIDEYILEQEKIGQSVIIFSKEAGIYMLPLQKNNGVLDLPFLGNLGKEGEDLLIKKISELESCKILLKKGDLFWQESKVANDYIRENYNKIGEIEEFEIYE